MKESVLMFCNKCGYELNDEDMFCPECGNKIKRQQSSSESFGVLETFETNAHLNNGDLLELLKTKSTDEFQEHQKKTISKGDIIYSATQSVNSDNSHENEKSMLDNAETTLSSLNIIEKKLSKKISDLGISTVYRKPNQADYVIQSTPAKKIISSILAIIFGLAAFIYFFLIILTITESDTSFFELLCVILMMFICMAIAFALPVRDHILCRKAYKNAVKNYEYNISQDEKRCRYEKEEAERLSKFLSVVKDKREQLEKVFNTEQKKYQEHYQPNAHDIYSDIKSHNDNENKAVTISNSIISEIEQAILFTDKKMEVTNFNQLINAADEIIKILN